MHPLPISYATVANIAAAKYGFIENWYSDVPLEGLEERIGRTAINDTYLGPPQLLTIRQASMTHVPFNQSSLSFLPPGVNIVTERM